MTAPRPKSEGDFEVLHPDPLRRVELALEDLRAGRMIILVDDEDRENEGDLVVAAEMVTADHINFMATWARGLICLSMTSAQVQRLGLTMMVTNNQSPYNTAFTVSIEAREGVSTGISASDRARTVKVAIDKQSSSRDLVTPGHMFPLRARDGGVLERVGQTEGSVNLARLAGLNPAGVICEVMREDGTMARMPDLEAFGRRHGLRICAVADVIKYRMRHERIVRVEAEGTLDTPGLGTWQTRLYRGTVHGDLHMALWKGALGPGLTTARVQAAPPPWATLDPDGNKLSRQVRAAQEAILQAGRGVLVLMHLDGGSAERIAQQFARDCGAISEAAPQQRAAALRDLGTGCQILVDLGLRDLRLLASSQRPIVGIEAYGLDVLERVLLPDTPGVSVTRTIEGHLTDPSGRFAIVAGRFNDFITSRLVAGCEDALRRHGIDTDQRLDLIWVPGSFEIPLACLHAAKSGNYSAVIALGAVIRGATPHFDLVAGEVSKGCGQVALQTGVPVIFGVLTTDTIEQAIERAGTKAGNKGFDAGLAAIEMVSLLSELKG